MPQEPYPPRDQKTQVNEPGRFDTPKGEYVTAYAIPILDEHEMAGSPGEPAMYCGPAELQKIADNNNRRIQETGDAAPVVIGHTEDDLPEDNQPDIVGYATNFKVGPLYNTGRMALLADMHVEKSQVKRVNKYPRRSVELWPKRWEVDPISLLGATTPERDLGLLQFRRGDTVVRYHRVGQHYDAVTTNRGHVVKYSRSLDPEVCLPIFNITERPRRHARELQHQECECSDGGCPCCKGKCKGPAAMYVHRTDMDDEDGTPMCEGCALDALDSGVFRGGKRMPHDHRPKRKSQIQTNRGQNHMAGHSYPTPIRTTPPARNGVGPKRYSAMDGGGDDANAAMVEAVLNSAPIQEMLTNSKKQGDMLQEIMQMIQSGSGEQDAQPGMSGQDGPQPDMGDEGGPSGQGPDAAGGEQQEARWMHEGEPIREGTAHAGAADQYEMGDDMDDEPDQYMLEDDDGDMIDDEEVDDPHHHNQPSSHKKYGAYGSPTNGFIPTTEGDMSSHRRGADSPRRNSRAGAAGHKKSHFEIYMESLRGNDEKVQYSRLEQRVKHQEKQLAEMNLERLQYSRAEQLRTLQITEGIDLDVAEEVTSTLPFNDEQFQAHLGHIKKRYKRDLSAVQPIRVAQVATPSGSAPMPAEASMNADQARQYARDVAERVMRYRRNKPDASESELFALARADLQRQAS